MGTNKRGREDAPPSTKPGGRVAANAAARAKRQEAPTLPPPPSPASASSAPEREPRQSHLRPKRNESAPAPRKKPRASSAPAANVDEVVADLRNDPRVDDDD